MITKIYNIILLFSYPLLFILKGFSKFFYLRFGNITPHRVGHLVGELSLWYLENQKSDKNIKNFWYVSKNSCNEFFIKKISKKINIKRNFVFKFLHDLATKFNEKKFVIEKPSYGERDMDSLISNNPNIIKFSDDEINLGNKYLEKLGLKQNDTFVCLIIRDNFFFKNFLKGNYNYKSSEFKNSNIENYNMAVKNLNKKKIKVIRMGAGSEKEWSLTDNLYNFDYSKSKYRSGFMDFYLVHKSKFTITNGTGFYWIPYLLKKPLVMADFIPIGGLCSYVPNSIHIFKHIFSNKKKRNLNLNELLSDDYNFIYKEEDFRKKDLTYIDNNPEEINDCVEEMNNLIDKNVEINKNLQNKFWNLMPKKVNKYSFNGATHKIINANIGSNFLKNQLDLNLNEKNI